VYRLYLLAYFSFNRKTIRTAKQNRTGNLLSNLPRQILMRVYRCTGRPTHRTQRGVVLGVVDFHVRIVFANICCKLIIITTLYRMIKSNAQIMKCRKAKLYTGTSSSESFFFLVILRRRFIYLCILILSRTKPLLNLSVRIFENCPCEYPRLDIRENYGIHSSHSKLKT